jgi:hypothetical protein
MAHPFFSSINWTDLHQKKVSLLMFDSLSIKEFMYLINNN